MNGGCGACGRIVLVSGHYCQSKRKAGFHFLAEAYARQGWHVTFMTTGISPISKWRGDARFDYAIEAEANRVKAVAERLDSFVWLTPWHPFHLRSEVLDRLSMPVVRAYGRLPLHGAEAFIAPADVVVYESALGLLLFDRFKALNPRARTVYRVSDDLANLGVHRLLRETEVAIAPRFDLISAPSRFTFQRFGHLPQTHLHPHAMATEAFDRPCASPYRGGARNVVSVGQAFFDHRLLPIACDLFPEWRFHVIGRVDGAARRSNLTYYGEMPFGETVPFIKHADIGLAPYAYRPGAEGLADSSLKLMQYTYCKVPAVAPLFATRQDRPHVFGYRPGDARSIRAALEAAAACDRRAITSPHVLSWDGLAHLIAELALAGSRTAA